MYWRSGCSVRSSASAWPYRVVCFWCGLFSWLAETCGSWTFSLGYGSFGRKAVDVIFELLVGSFVYCALGFDGGLPAFGMWGSGGAEAESVWVRTSLWLVSSFDGPGRLRLSCWMGLSSFDIMYVCSPGLVGLMSYELPSNVEESVEDADHFAESSLHIWDHVKLGKIAADFQLCSSKPMSWLNFVVAVPPVQYTIIPARWKWYAWDTLVLLWDCSLPISQLNVKVWHHLCWSFLGWLIELLYPYPSMSRLGYGRKRPFCTLARGFAACLLQFADSKA